MGIVIAMLLGLVTIPIILGILFYMGIQAVRKSAKANADNDNNRSIHADPQNSTLKNIMIIIVSIVTIFLSVITFLNNMPRNTVDGGVNYGLMLIVGGVVGVPVLLILILYLIFKR